MPKFVQRLPNHQKNFLHRLESLVAECSSRLPVRQKENHHRLQFFVVKFGNLRLVV